MNLFAWAIESDKKDDEPVKEESPNIPKNSGSKTVNMTLKAESPAPIVDLTVPMTGTQPVVDDQMYVTMFNEKLNEAAQKSTSVDFMKFVASVNALSQVLPDEVSRIKAAFATVQVTSKATVNEILASADNYIGIIDEIQSFFDDWSKNFNSNEVNNRENEISKFQTEKANKQALIEKLSAEIIELSTKEATILAEIQEKKSTLQGKVVAFASAKSKIHNNLTSIRDSIRKTLS